MGKLIQLDWPVIDPSAYALEQNVNDGETFYLIGTRGGNLPHLSYGSRTVTISQSNLIDYSAINFIIRGFNYNETVEETINGLDGFTKTIETTKTFTDISSIQVDGGNVETVFAGTGFKGYLTPVTLDVNASSPSTSLQVIVNTDSGPNIVNYSVVGSLSNINKLINDVIIFNDETFNDTFEIDPNLTGATSTQITNVDYPIQTVICKINDSQANGFISLLVAQQGLR